MTWKVRLEQVRSGIERWGVPLVIILALVLPAWAQAQDNRNTLQVVCDAAARQQETLRALKRVSTELGIPGEFPITPMPEECP